jgi:hypothetical protein
MAEAVRYLVVCKCTGRIEPIAYIDDNRPTGGRVAVSATNPAMKQIISARGFHTDYENWRAPDAFAATLWVGYNVTETVLDWETGCTTWTIRCIHCDEQAQMSSTTLERVLESGDWKSVPSLEPADSVVKTWTADGWAMEIEDTEPGWSQRNLVVLGVLVTASQRNV